MPNGPRHNEETWRFFFFGGGGIGGLMLLCPEKHPVEAA